MRFLKRLAKVVIFFVAIILVFNIGTKAYMFITAEAPDDYAGTYQNVSLFKSSRLVLNSDETFDLYDGDDRILGGTVTGNAGNFNLESAETAGQKMHGSLSQTGNYLYGNNQNWNVLMEDAEYGEAPTFDENGQCTQSFSDTIYPTIFSGYWYVPGAARFNWEINFYSGNEFDSIIYDQTGLPADETAGTYKLEGEILTLTNSDDGDTTIFIYKDDAIYIDVYEKQE